MQRQRGLSLIGLIIIGAVLAFVAIIGFKLLPAYVEYFSVKRAVTDLARGTEVRGGTVRDVMNAFDRRATIDGVTSIRGTDLEVTKQGDGFAIVANYSVSVPLFGNIRACLDFEASAE
jgi:hypothetical protein